MSVRRLRTLRDGGRFEAAAAELPPATQARVFEVLRGLRADETLPGDADVGEVIPPCMPAGWRRAVPGSDLWVYYKVSKDRAYVDLLSVRVPETMSAAAAEALEAELAGPPPTPYIRLVTDDPEETPSDA